MSDPFQNVWRMLVNLAPSCDRATRNLAAEHLLALVGRIAAQSVPNQRQSLLDEVQSAVVANVIRKHQGPILSLLDDTRDDLANRDARCCAFIRTMVQNYRLDILRREKRARQFDADAQEFLGEEAIQAQERETAERRLGEALVLVARVVDAAAEARQPRHRDDLRKTWSLIREIACEGCPVRVILTREDGISDTSPRAEVTAARNRIYKRCERLRRELLDVADRLRQEGTLPDQEHVLVVGFITGVMVRCQRGDPSNVKGGA